MDWTHRLRLRSLRALAAIETMRNLSRAAEQIGISQPALSKWLNELEKDIGLPLFERSSRGLTSTVYGRVLINHAKRVEAHIGLAAAEMAALRDGSTGRVVIGSAGSSGRNTVPSAVLCLLERYPKASVSMVEAPIDALMEQLKRGEIDVLVGRSSVACNDAQIRNQVLYTEPVIFVVRPGHPLAGAEHVSWDDLLRYPWLTWPAEMAIQKQVAHAMEQAGIAGPATTLQSDSITLNLSILEDSDFVGTASLRAAERFSHRGMLHMIVFDGLGSSDIAMYWRDEGVPRHAVTAMIECLRIVASPLSDRHNLPI